MSPKEIHEEMRPILVENTLLPMQQEKKREAEFKRGKDSTEDDSLSGLLKTSTIDVQIGAIYSMVLNYRYFIIFTNPSARAGYDTRSIFKWSLTGLNLNI